MPKRIFVGNLPYTATEDEIREMFEEYGTVNQVNLITDRETGQPRGFGFVEMDDDDAEAAISALEGKDLQGRALRVNEARPRTDRGDRGGRGGGGGGGGRGPRRW